MYHIVQIHIKNFDSLKLIDWLKTWKCDRLSYFYLLPWLHQSIYLWKLMWKYKTMMAWLRAEVMEFKYILNAILLLSFDFLIWSILRSIPFSEAAKNSSSCLEGEKFCIFGWLCCEGQECKGFKCTRKEDSSSDRVDELLGPKVTDNQLPTSDIPSTYAVFYLSAYRIMYTLWCRY